MAWTRARLGVYLTRNPDGSTKDEPLFWVPPKASFSIPEAGREHGRPVLFLNGGDPGEAFFMILDRDGITAKYQGEVRRLVEL
jgi:hypothetical protein